MIINIVYDLWKQNFTSLFTREVQVCVLYTMYGQGDMMKHCCNNHMLAYVMLYVGIMKT